ncbi:hypothetical protein BGZ73_005429 [Actinomortierella ambigua]|nr:hypothetical protein BGZ73_005429 [Actinomortierella ambigua]
MATAARPNAKAGKPVMVQRGGKGKWGVSSPPAGSQSGLSPAGSPTLQQQQPSGQASPVTREPVVIGEVDAKHMHDRMLYLLMSMVGMVVEVTVKNGTTYEGVFTTASTEGDLGVVLSMARAISGKDKKDGAPPIGALIILPKDLVHIRASSVDFTPQEKPLHEREGFKTDTDISRAGEIRERDLQKWAPDEGLPLESLEDNAEGSSHVGWDQFAANERLFGVRTEFDEELYTTKLDRSGADFKERELKAIKIANEIQQGATSNVHMLEERGIAIDDSGMDEEDRYGAVVRDPLPPAGALTAGAAANPTPNKYMPPAMRRQQELNAAKQQQQQQQQQQQPVAAPTPTKPTPAPVQTTSLPQPSSANSASRPSPLPKTPLSDLRTANNPVSALMNSATIQGAMDKKIPLNAPNADQIEEEMMQNIRKFASNEKERLNQEKERLSQKRIELEKKEKEKAQKQKEEWIEFSKKLTLTTPVPEDLKEMLNKSKSSKTAKEEAPKEPAGTKEEPASAATTASASASSATATTTTVTTTTSSTAATTTSVSGSTSVGTESKPAEKPAEKPADKPADKPASTFKLNAKASVFKPNVNAVPFTPSGALATAAAADKKADKTLAFFGKAIRKGPMELEKVMGPPFQKGKAIPASTSVTPTWSTGGKRMFRHMFQESSGYEEDMYGGQAGPGGYYQMGSYRYPAPFFPGAPPMTMGAPAHIMPMMSPVPIPFSQPMGPPGTAPAAGFPPMAPVTAPPFATQGFPSPGRTGVMSTGMHMPVYPYAPGHPGGPMMVRYPPPEMMQGMGPGGVMLPQRPMMDQSPMMPFPPGGEGVPTTTSPEQPIPDGAGH